MRRRKKERKKGEEEIKKEGEERKKESFIMSRDVHSHSEPQARFPLSSLSARYFLLPPLTRSV